MTGSKSASPSNCIELYSAFFCHTLDFIFKDSSQSRSDMCLFYSQTPTCPHRNVSFQRWHQRVQLSCTELSDKVLGLWSQTSVPVIWDENGQFRLEKMGLWGFIVPSFRLAHVHWVDWIEGKIWRPWNIGVSSIFPQVVMLANSEFILHLPFEYWVYSP